MKTAIFTAELKWLLCYADSKSYRVYCHNCWGFLSSISFRRKITLLTLTLSYSQYRQTHARIVRTVCIFEFIHFFRCCLLVKRIHICLFQGSPSLFALLSKETRFLAWCCCCVVVVVFVALFVCCNFCYDAISIIIITFHYDFNVNFVRFVSCIEWMSCALCEWVCMRDGIGHDL